MLHFRNEEIHELSENEKRALEQPFSSLYHFLIFLYTITQNSKPSRKPPTFA